MNQLESLLAFPLRDEQWAGKFAVGTGLLLASFVVPILPALFVYGYLLRVMRNAVEDGELELPAWGDWGGLFKDGLKALVVGGSYLLPGLTLILCGTMLYCLAAIAIPISAEASPAAASDDVLGLLVLAAMLLFFLSIAFGSFLALLGALPLPVAAANMVAELRLGAAYRLRHLARLLAVNPVGWFAAWVVLFGLLAITYALMTIGYYTLVLSCVVPVLLMPFSFYALLIGAAQFGLAYRASDELLTDTRA